MRESATVPNLGSINQRNDTESLIHTHSSLDRQETTVGACLVVGCLASAEFDVGTDAPGESLDLTGPILLNSVSKAFHPHAGAPDSRRSV